MREKPGVPQIREPAVAGLFYPDDPLLLQQQVDNLLAQDVPIGAAPKAGRCQRLPATGPHS
jgi:predicted class III extradiol MEMO1 family dioxygenase